MDPPPPAVSARPPFSPLRYYVLPQLIIAIALATRPQTGGTTWRLATLAALGALLAHALHTDTGDLVKNYSMGSACGSMFLSALTLFLLSNPLEECRYETQDRPVREMPLWKRIHWMRSVYSNTRGIGWNYQFEHLPPRPTHTRAQFVASRAARLAWYALLADAADTYLDLNPLFARSGAAARSLRAQGALLTAANVLAYMTVSYSSFNMTYDALALVSVALGVCKPSAWPVAFGRWRDAYTVRRFWGRTWHQMMRRFVSTLGKHTARALRVAPGTWLSARIQLLVGFSASGLAHVPGDAMVAPRWTGASYAFFAAQALAITAEDALLALGRRAGVRGGPAARALGYAWTAAWFAAATPAYLDWMMAAGMGRHRVFAGSVVRPVLRWAAERTGVDVMGSVEEFCAAR